MFFLNPEYLTKLQARAWLSHALCARGQHTAKRRRKCTRQSRFACNFANYLPIKMFFFTHRLSNKPFLIWLLTVSPHFKYTATLPCNLSLRARFADINVSQCIVATYARCGGIFSRHLTANLPGNLPVQTYLNRLRFDRIMVMSLWRCFWPTLYVLISTLTSRGSEMSASNISHEAPDTAAHAALKWNKNKTRMRVISASP